MWSTFGDVVLDEALEASAVLLSERMQGVEPDLRIVLDPCPAKGNDALKVVGYPLGHDAALTHYGKANLGVALDRIDLVTLLSAVHADERQFLARIEQCVVHGHRIRVAVGTMHGERAKLAVAQHREALVVRNVLQLASHLGHAHGVFSVSLTAQQYGAFAQQHNGKYTEILAIIG